MESTRLESRLLKAFSMKIGDEKAALIVPKLIEMLAKRADAEAGPSSNFANMFETAPNSRLGTKSGDLELPSATNALRHVRELAGSVDFFLHQSADDEIKFRSRLDTIASEVAKGQLSPQNERSIAYLASQAAEILEPYTKGNFLNVIDPDRVPRQLDRVLANMEHILGVSAENAKGLSSDAKAGEVRDQDFEKFIDAAGSTDVAQNPLPLNSATRALTDLDAAFQSMSPENHAAYNESISFMRPDGYEGKLAPSVLLRQLSSIGGRQLGYKEEDGPLSTEDRDQIIAITGEIRDIFAQAEAAPDALIKKLVELEQAILKALGTEYLNP